jgi:hypothetical protein
MKWCTNCQANRESWAERGYSGSNYDIKCWNCDNLTLASATLVQEGTHGRALVNSTKSSGLVGEFEYKVEVGNKYTGQYRSESLTYKPPQSNNR